jgi:hypothetical protein
VNVAPHGVAAESLVPMDMPGKKKGLAGDFSREAG